MISGVPVVTTLVCSLHIAREAAGALGTRHSLRPLFIEGHCLAKLGRLAPRERVLMFEIRKPSLRANGSRECAPDDRLREVIHLAAQRKNGLLRRYAPRNDDLKARHILNRHRPARPGDPVFQRRRDKPEKPRRTGYPLGSRHKCNTC